MEGDSLDIFDHETGALIRDNDEEIVKLDREANLIRDEFDKISKHKQLRKSMQELLTAELFVLDNTDKPKYVLRVLGRMKDEVEKESKKAVDKFITDEHYAFHKYHNQLKRELSWVIGKGLNESMPESEFWCSTAEESITMLGVQSYLFYIIKFDKNRLNTCITFNKKRHPLIDDLRIEWEREFGKYFNMSKRINYNEMFRKASARENFLCYYQDDLNALSAMKYENEINRGSIIALKTNRDDLFEEIVKNYDVSLELSSPIKIVPDNYKKIRKLLEITQAELSLLINDKKEVFAIGKMKKESSCEFYKISFTKFLEWKYYKNEEEYLRFSNILPSFPEKGTGIQNEDVELLTKTFGKKYLSKLQKLIENATKQKHGTMVVITENAKEEVDRLGASGIPISPTRLADKQVEAVTSIDGAIICDKEGVCYAIGAILDGKVSNDADSSRGARYNSAIRYRDMRREDGKKTFIVIVSEDGYIDCVSTA